MVILVFALIFDLPFYSRGILLSVIFVGFIARMGKETLICSGGLLAFSVIIFLLQVFPTGWTGSLQYLPIFLLFPGAN